MYIKLKPNSVVKNGNFTKVTYQVTLREIPCLVPEKFLDRYVKNLNNAIVLGCGNTYEILFYVTGTSKCGEEDEYNHMVGLDLAEYRAAVSAYNKASKILNAIDNESIRLKIGLHNFVDSLSSDIIYLEDKINALIDEAK